MLIITYREGDIKSPEFLNTNAGRQSRSHDNQKSGIKYITNVDKESNILPNEKLINKLLRKKEREVKKYLNKNKQKLNLIVELLIKQGSINKKELFDIMNN